MKDEHITAIIWAIAVVAIIYFLADKFKNIRCFVTAEGVTFGVEATERRDSAPELAEANYRIVEGK